MLVVLVGIILLFSNPNIGIFVIVLGVMVWTSGKSRTSHFREARKKMRRESTRLLPHLAAAEITPVRSDNHPQPRT